jgi:hypothetical protein
VAAALAVLDAALRSWRPWRASVAGNLLFLGIAWIPFFAFPHMGARPVSALIALLALAAMVDFSRMVGLTLHGRFFLPAFVLSAACFPAAAWRGGGALGAMPVVALLVLTAAGAAGREPRAFLQKLCLAWLAVLVYGYVYAHAVLVVRTSWRAVAPTTMLALIILIAKFANVGWLIARRASGRERIQLVAAPVGGAVGGWAVGALWPALGFAQVHLPAVGLVIGLALGVGTRAHVLIVADVTGEPERQRKGTMLFGFGLALATGYALLALTARG